MARPTKYDEAIVGKICERLRAGCTRRASAIGAGISDDTFNRWMRSYAGFAAKIETAEADCEVRNTAIIEKAAFGYDATRTVRTVRTVVKPRKMYFSVGGTVRTKGPGGQITETFYPPGTRIEEPVALEEVSAQTTVAFEFDWHAALEVLKRRFRLHWGDKAEIDWKKLTSEQILEILMRSVPQDSAAPAAAAGGAGESGGGGAEAGAGPAGAGG